MVYFSLRFVAHELGTLQDKDKAITLNQVKWKFQMANLMQTGEQQI